MTSRTGRISSKQAGLPFCVNILLAACIAEAWLCKHALCRHAECAPVQQQMCHAQGQPVVCVCMRTAQIAQLTRQAYSLRARSQAEIDKHAASMAGCWVLPCSGSRLVCVAAGAMLQVIVPLCVPVSQHLCWFCLGIAAAPGGLTATTCVLVLVQAELVAERWAMMLQAGYRQEGNRIDFAAIQARASGRQGNLDSLWKLGRQQECRLSLLLMARVVQVRIPNCDVVMFTHSGRGWGSTLQRLHVLSMRTPCLWPVGIWSARRRCAHLLPLATLQPCKFLGDLCLCSGAGQP